MRAAAEITPETIYALLGAIEYCDHTECSCECQFFDAGRKGSCALHVPMLWNRELLENMLPDDGLSEACRLAYEESRKK